MKRVAVFASGRGSNLQALMDQEGCNIRLLCTHKSIIPADKKAKRFGIPVWKTKTVDFREWQSKLESLNICKIFLLGFMKLVPGFFVARFQEKILNIHPSLLPKYPGLNSLELCFQNLDDAGVTIHQVIEEMDAGPIVCSSKVAASADMSNLNFEILKTLMTFREHYLTRRVGEKWI